LKQLLNAKNSTIRAVFADILALESPSDNLEVESLTDGTVTGGVLNDHSAWERTMALSFEVLYAGGREIGCMRVWQSHED
jgi:hypothetical protein